MDKGDKLYFLPILIEAFENQNPIESFEKALLEIHELGKHSENFEGFEQFNKFLEIGIQSQEISDFALLDKVLIGIASESIILDPKIRNEIIEEIKANKNLICPFPFSHLSSDILCRN